MTLALNGVNTTDGYPIGNTGGVQLGPDSRGTQLDLVVGNAAAAVQVWYAEPGGPGALGGSQLSDEFIIVAGNGQIVQASYKNCLGFRARSFIAGKPATIYATLWEVGDPVPLGGSSYAGTLTSSGSGPGVTAINVQHNDVLVGTEQTIDFEDGGIGTWTVVDDAANTRVKIGQVLGVPQAYVQNLAANQVIPTTTQETLTGATSQIIYGSSFAVSLGPPAKITLLAGSGGLFGCTLQTFWNAGGADVNSLAQIVTSSIFLNSQMADPLGGTVFASRLSNFVVPASVVANTDIVPSVLQETGGNQTLSAWTFSAYLIP